MNCHLIVDGVVGKLDLLRTVNPPTLPNLIFRDVYSRVMEAIHPIALHRPKLRPLAVVLLAAFGSFLVACSVASLRIALSSGEPLMGRLLMITMATVSIILPGWFAVASLRLKCTKGRWTLPPEERHARLDRYTTGEPSLPVRLVSSLAFRMVMNSMMVVLAAVNIWVQLRQGLHAFEVVLIVVWLAVAALSLWQLLHRHQTSA